ncbi:hypothetical protein [Micromonospora siamensis]|uniref:Uncharacterized protein n=1 Tax=Micromonospora siamensis TaxID=299152 RepID=A0A1C5HF03_9ACTN|nr:hypothetical protein [Micromonospora siamensis]SCG44596.1 hypothetical protein GA0074704_1612 [Micromonospora siamensis]
MTSPDESASTDPTPARRLTEPLREPAALALLGANAVFLFVGLLRLLVPNGYGDLTDRADVAYSFFVGLNAALLPLLAVLLATHVRPVLPQAALVTKVALGEYAVSGVLGALSFLIWMVGRLAEGEVFNVLLGVLSRAGWLVLVAVGALVVWKVWSTLYRTPKPPPGVYGQPQPGWPQQPAGWPAPGQPAGPYGQPSAPTGPQYGQPYPGQPGAGPQFAPPAGQSPPPAGQYGQPHAPYSAPPATGAQPAHPAPPFGQPPSADPTQTIPRQPGEPAGQESDRTQPFRRDDQNPPR